MTGSIIGRLCRGGLCSAFELGSPIDTGATLSPTIGDGVHCSQIVGDWPPIEAGYGTVWGEGDVAISIEGVCISVCYFDYQVR